MPVWCRQYSLVNNDQMDDHTFRYNGAIERWFRFLGADIGVKATCEKQSGKWVPSIDINRCEGKGPCVDACPFNVLAMGELTQYERGQLTFVGRVKAFVHRGKQARVVLPDECKACNVCVERCPENAIALVSV